MRTLSLGKIKAMWLSGMSVEEMSEETGLSADWFDLVMQTDGWRLVEPDHDDRSSEPGSGEDIRQDGKAEGSQ